jgi:hypothetical protein
MVLLPLGLTLGCVAGEVFSQGSYGPELSLEDSILVNTVSNKFMDEPMDNGLRRSISAVAMLYLKSNNHSRVAHAFFTQQKGEYFLNTSSQNVAELKIHPIQTIYFALRKEWIDIRSLKWEKSTLSGAYSAKIPHSFQALKILKKAEKLGLIHVTNMFQGKQVSVSDDLFFTPSLLGFGKLTTSTLEKKNGKILLVDFIQQSCNGVSGSPVFVKKNNHYEVIGVHDGVQTSSNQQCNTVNTVSLLAKVKLTP